MPAPSIAAGWTLSMVVQTGRDSFAPGVEIRLYEADGETLRGTWTRQAKPTTLRAGLPVDLVLTAEQVTSIETWDEGLCVDVAPLPEPPARWTGDDTMMTLLLLFLVAQLVYGYFLFRYTF